MPWFYGLTWFSGLRVDARKCYRRPETFEKRLHSGACLNHCCLVSFQHPWRCQRLCTTALRRWERNRTRSRFHHQPSPKIRNPHRVNHPRSHTPAVQSPTRLTRPSRKPSKQWVMLLSGIFNLDAVHYLKPFIKSLKLNFVFLQLIGRETMIGLFLKILCVLFALKHLVYC